MIAKPGLNGAYTKVGDRVGLDRRLRKGEHTDRDV
jgi:hypothetical protein